MPTTAINGPAAQGRPTPGNRVARAALIALLVMLSAALVAPALLHATDAPKVVVVVGPVGGLNRYYKDEARSLIEEARRHTPNVVVLFTPKATWKRVRAAAQGASVFVYFGHGWGYPSRYTPFDPERQNGVALDPARGANGTRRVYFGEDRIRASIRLAPGAAVLLYRLCYASGNTEPGLAEGTLAQSKRRVDGFGAGFLAAGAGIVIADGHPSSTRNYVRQLFQSSRTMLEVFRAAPNHHRHELGPYVSARTPDALYVLDPDRGGRDPRGFYRSIVGDLELRTETVTGRPVPTPSPSDEPTPSPSDGPTPSDEPTPSPEPTVDPTAGPTPSPSDEPTPSPEPTIEPTSEPTAEPTPPVAPSPEPTAPTAP